MKTNLFATLVGIGLGTAAMSPALAQTTTTPSTTTPSTTAPAGTMAPAGTTTPSGTMAPAGTTTPSGTMSPGTSSMNATGGGLMSAQTATVQLRFVSVQPADFLSSRLVGTNVYNNQNESLGEIEDLVIENGKTIKAVVIGVGGFLGMGERYVAVDPSTVVLNRQNDNSWKAMVDTSKDNLKNAPTFNYSKKR